MRILPFLGSIAVLVMLADIGVQRLKVAGHIRSGTSWLESCFQAFIVPVLWAVWAGLYEMIRTVARGRRQKPPFDAFLLAWITQRAQPVQKTFRVLRHHGEQKTERDIQVTHWVQPPRPAGRPRKYPEGWRKARLTGRPRGRPRKDSAQKGGSEPT